MRKWAGDERQRGDRVKRVERADAADAIRERAAEGPQHRADKGAERREVAGLHGREAVFAFEIKDVAARETDEAAEADGVIETEPVRVLVAQQRDVIGETFPFHLDLRLARKEHVHREHEHRGNERETEDAFPAIGRGDARREQAVDDHAHIARAG